MNDIRVQIPLIAADAGDALGFNQQRFPSVDLLLCALALGNLKRDAANSDHPACGIAFGTPFQRKPMQGMIRINDTKFEVAAGIPRERIPECRLDIPPVLGMNGVREGVERKTPED